MFNRSYYEVHV